MCSFSLPSFLSSLSGNSHRAPSPMPPSLCAVTVAITTGAWTLSLSPFLFLKVVSILVFLPLSVSLFCLLEQPFCYDTLPTLPREVPFPLLSSFFLSSHPFSRLPLVPLCWCESSALRCAHFPLCCGPPPSLCVCPEPCPPECFMQPGPGPAPQFS